MAKNSRYASARLTTTVNARYVPDEQIKDAFYLDGRFPGLNEKRAAEDTLDRDDRGFLFALFAYPAERGENAAEADFVRSVRQLNDQVKEGNKSIDIQINDLADASVEVCGKATLPQAGIRQAYFAGIIVKEAEIAAVTTAAGCAFLYRGDVLYPLTASDFKLEPYDLNGNPIERLNEYSAGVAGTIRYSNITPIKQNDCLILCNKEVAETLGQREMLRILDDAQDQKDAAANMITAAAAKQPGMTMQVMISFVEYIEAAEKTGRLSGLFPGGQSAPQTQENFYRENSRENPVSAQAGAAAPQAPLPGNFRRQAEPMMRNQMNERPGQTDRQQWRDGQNPSGAPMPQRPPVNLPPQEQSFYRENPGQRGDTQIWQAANVARPESEKIQDYFEAGRRYAEESTSYQPADSGVEQVYQNDEKPYSETPVEGTSAFREHGQGALEGNNGMEASSDKAEVAPAELNSEQPLTASEPTGAAESHAAPLDYAQPAAAQSPDYANPTYEERYQSQNGQGNDPTLNQAYEQGYGNNYAPQDDRAYDRSEQYRQDPGYGQNAYADQQGYGYGQSGEQNYDQGYGNGQSGEQNYDQGYGYGQTGEQNYDQGYGYGQTGEQNYDQGYGYGQTGEQNYDQGYGYGQTGEQNYDQGYGYGQTGEQNYDQSYGYGQTGEQNYDQGYGYGQTGEQNYDQGYGYDQTGEQNYDQGYSQYYGQNPQEGYGAVDPNYGQAGAQPYTNEQDPYQESYYDEYQDNYQDGGYPDDRDEKVKRIIFYSILGVVILVCAFLIFRLATKKPATPVQSNSSSSSASSSESQTTVKESEKKTSATSSKESKESKETKEGESNEAGESKEEGESNPTSEESTESKAKGEAKTYTVRLGDTLYQICMSYYGKYSDALGAKIAEANPNLQLPDVFEGNVIKLPPLEDLEP